MHHKEVPDNTPKWLSKLQEAFGKWHKDHKSQPELQSELPKSLSAPKHENAIQNLTPPLAFTIYKKKINPISHELAALEKKKENKVPTNNTLFVSQILQISISGRATADQSDNSHNKPKKR